MTRIAVGGFLHETNTFAPTRATYDDFVHGGGWPAMAVGTDVLRVMRGINVGLVGVHQNRPALAFERTVEPTEQAILVNKSSVHFRADFEPIAEKL